VGKMTSIYLCLGSNLGDRFKNILKALQTLKEAGFNIKKISSIYETSPWGKTNQPYFLNLVLKGETKLSPKGLLKKIKNIEKTFGRETAEKRGPRIIDIDILFYKEEIINTPFLKIPHPLLHKRVFVLIPLKEIAPHLIHPILKQTPNQMLNNLNDKGSVVLYNKIENEKN
jgi:2-amino-4-hydroxy-6-hydroxymethyldihydropteridine diphosphokinase